jgi:hypothetical protein
MRDNFMLRNSFKRNPAKWRDFLFSVFTETQADIVEVK